MYDSEKDTTDHVNKVREILKKLTDDIEVHGLVHDVSKLGSEEKPIFDIVTPKLKKLTYGSEEYNA